MAELFARDSSFQVGELKFVSLRAAFKASRTLDRKPNTAELRLFNLSETSRQKIEETDGGPVIIRAGYKDPGAWDIFVGEKRKAYSSREGPDIVTVVEAADGERRIRSARINRSFGPGTALRTAIEGAASALGLGTGNLAQVAAAAGFEGLGNQFAEGVVLSGPAAGELSGLLDSAGIEWSVQGGDLQLLLRGQPLAGQAIRLTPFTGLVQSPSIDSENVMKAQALMIPGLVPGALTQVESEFVTGNYRIVRADYVGDTHGNEWYSSIEGKAA